MPGGMKNLKRAVTREDVFSISNCSYRKTGYCRRSSSKRAIEVWNSHKRHSAACGRNQRNALGKADLYPHLLSRVKRTPLVSAEARRSRGLLRTAWFLN